MPRNRGDHLEWRKVKTAIIELILSNNGAVPEPEIREFLRKEYDIRDQGNIKKHLGDLQNRPYSCIEKIPPKQRGFANKWDIKRLENIKNIRLHFPEINIKTYEKCLNIVLNEHLQSIDSPRANEFRIQLFLSDSFFDICLKTHIETLHEKAFEIYQLSYDKYREGPPKEWKQRVMEDISREISYDMFPKMLKAIPLKLITPEEMLRAMSEAGIKDIPEEMVKTIVEEKMKKVKEESLKTMYEVGIEKIKEMVLENISKEAQGEIPSELFKIMLQHALSRLLISDIIFEHCFHEDIIEGTVSPEEKEFMSRTKEMDTHFKANPEINPISEIQAYNDFYIKYFEELRKNGVNKNYV